MKLEKYSKKMLTDEKAPIFAFWSGTVDDKTLFTVLTNLSYSKKRIVIYDCDPSGWLTLSLLVSDFSSNDVGLEIFHKKELSGEKLGSFSQQIVNSAGSTATAAVAYDCTAKNLPGFFLVPADDKLVDLGWNYQNNEFWSQSRNRIFSLTGLCPNHVLTRTRAAFHATAQKYNADASIVVLSGEKTIMNKSIAMMSDYLIGIFNIRGSSSLNRLKTVFAFSQFESNMEEWRLWREKLYTHELENPSFFPWPSKHPNILSFIRYNNENLCDIATLIVKKIEKDTDTTGLNFCELA